MSLPASPPRPAATALAVLSLLFLCTAGDAQSVIIHYANGTTTALPFQDILTSEPYGADVKFTLQNDSILYVPIADLRHIDFTDIATAQRPDGALVGLDVSIAPNPSSTVSRIRLKSTGTAQPQVVIQDGTGALIKVLKGGSRSAGEAELTWDLTDAENRPVPSGAYFCRVTTDTGTIVRKLIVQH